VKVRVFLFFFRLAYCASFWPFQSRSLVGWVIEQPRLIEKLLPKQNWKIIFRSFRSGTNYNHDPRKNKATKKIG